MTMRAFLHLLTLVALLFAPLAAPAAAMTMVQQTSVDCEEMEMAATKHQMPSGEHRNADQCCIAVPAAIALPAAALDRIVPLGHLPFVALAQPFRLGAGPQSEDPPPRHA